MIGKLTGIIDSFSDSHLILDVNGVGYLVHVSRRTLGRIGNKGDPASLLIDTNVREDAITLYGFADPAEQQWFKLLTSVQGVGAKVGLSILSIAAPDKIALAIAAQDKGFITQADGVGPKLALRILTELKDKAANLQLGNVSGPVTYSKLTEDSEVPKSIDSDAVSALVNLGYTKSDAFTAVQRAKEKANDNLQDLIRVALKELSA
jgi:holliday junction DNA helicase RuvA